MKNFDALPYEEKIYTLVMNCSFINSINYYNQKVDLYHMGDFFIEVFYHPVTFKIDQICTADRSRLHLYSPVNIDD
ncbi:hypothetical protein [Chondrinema litorale]|uniref:hypothetical protein n=1 Tax=Chondrinema litorale TaxID=2994555 RepID=UPI00254363A0|nr:hypothetical protein [Chondrinema litorale]UZR99985.1 hypothetical protein OQ292_39075 [Chondrinema litorale]